MAEQKRVLGDGDVAVIGMPSQNDRIASDDGDEAPVTIYYNQSLATTQNDGNDEKLVLTSGTYAGKTVLRAGKNATFVPQ